MMRIVFWQQNLSIHQSALIRALAGMRSYDVTLVTATDLSVRRQQMGWSVPDFGAAEVVHAPGFSDLGTIVARFSSREVTHVFSGIHAYPTVYEAFRRVIRSDATVGILSEAGSSFGVRSHFSLLRNRYNAVRFSKRIDFILAIGRLGVDWYVHSGFPASRIFEFGYFIDALDDVVCVSPRTGPITLAFVGTLYPLKGLDILIQALKELEHHNWRLLVVGDGPEAGAYRSLADRYFPSERVAWLGTLPNNEVRQVLGGADALILPSHGDGWGAVVSEALLAGTRVVCSDRCGAAVLVEGSKRGCVVRAGNVESLRNGLERVLSQGRLPDEERRAIANWAIRITGVAGAEYLDAIIRFVENRGERPTPPWSYDGNPAEAFLS